MLIARQPPGGREIAFRFSIKDARRVELAGEVVDWLAPRALPESPGAEGTFEARLSLPDGVYAYKLKVDGAWTLDPDNPRTRAQGGLQNSVLSVGGAPEPLLFAPAAPFVHEADRGGVVIACGLRRGAGESLAIRWTEGSGALESHTPMERVFEEDEHVFFRAHLPLSAARARYAFMLDDQRQIGPADGALFVHERAPAEQAAPRWWRDAVVYTIFVDRFRAAENDDAWPDVATPDVACGGHLEGIARSLDELSDLGVTVLYLTPVHVAASCHRYDFVDPMSVDPALGGEEAFERLIAACERRGMRVLVDLSLSHAGRGFAPYEDVIARGRASRFAPWFLWNDGALVHYGERTDAPLLDLDHPDVRTMALEVVDAWARRGVAGFRLDAAAEVPFSLARAMRRRLREHRPDGVVLGEVVPAHAWRWRTEEAIDAATDFGFHALATEFVALGTIDASRAVRRLAGIDLARGPDHATLRFLSTHDHARFATLARAEREPAKTALGLVLLATSAGIPALLYGEEVGLAADVASLVPEGAWGDRMPMAWSGPRRDEGLRALVKRLFTLRASSVALREGETRILYAEGDVLAFRRAAAGEVIDVVLNVGDATVEASLDDDENPSLEVLVFSGEIGARGATVTLGARSALVARRGAGERRRLALVDHPRARDAELAASITDVRTRPTRIDFSVTERCNLRCQHCITDAPERTRAGTARTLSPFVLDRLQDDLGFASYFGFVHGGEPLAAPALFDVLHAIGRARDGAPYVAHVLSNGVLLTERTTRRLIDAGVSSLSVSLDGATAETNDAVRVGGRFEQIVQHIKQAAALKRTADLRLGISFVVMKHNVHELPQLIDLCARIGVDWVKLEEVAPVNAFAARSLLRFDRRAAREAALRACTRGRELGLVVVDHTRDRTIWRCALDEETRAFLEDDEFANRSTIHPCRAAWERACIDPDGVVHAGDFFGPALGSVAEEPLSLLWRNHLARGARERSIAARLCGGGPVTCV